MMPQREQDQVMTTETSLEQAKAAVGFAALAIGKGHAALLDNEVTLDAATLEAMTQGVSQWLRTRYSSDMIDRAKTALGLSDAQQQDDADDTVIAAAHEASDAALERFFAPLAETTSTQDAFKTAQTALQHALYEAYGDASEGDDAPSA